MLSKISHDGLTIEEEEDFNMTQHLPNNVLSFLTQVRHLLMFIRASESYKDSKFVQLRTLV